MTKGLNVSSRTPEPTFFFSSNFILIFILCWSMAVLVSGVQQGDSVIHMHNLFSFKFFSHLGYYRILSQASCAILQSAHS